MAGEDLPASSIYQRGYSVSYHPNANHESRRRAAKKAEDTPTRMRRFLPLYLNTFIICLRYTVEHPSFSEEEAFEAGTSDVWVDDDEDVGETANGNRTPNNGANGT